MIDSTTSKIQGPFSSTYKYSLTFQKIKNNILEKNFICVLNTYEVKQLDCVKHASFHYIFPNALTSTIRQKIYKLLFCSINSLFNNLSQPC